MYIVFICTKNNIHMIRYITFRTVLILCGIWGVLPNQGKSQTGNVTLGTNAGAGNTTGNYNTLIGEGSGRIQSNVNGSTFIGYLSGENNTGGGNIFVGGYVGRGNTSGYYNSFIGWSAGYGNTTGYFNTYYGTSAGYSITLGNNNTFIGGNTGRNINLSPTPMTNNNCTYLGYDASGNVDNLTNATAIGYGSRVSSSNSLVLGSTSTNVGIGVTAPTARLEVSSGTTGTSGIKLTNLTSNSTPQASNGKALSLDASGNIILTSTNSATSFWTINASSNIISNSNGAGVIIGSGITSTPPGYSLYVSNGILTPKIRVATVGGVNWADYVFDKKYKLRPLSDVKVYIDKYKHLPNIPSAAQVMREGVDLLEINQKLLEKVEELTLYVISLDKELKEVKKAQKNKSYSK